MKPTLPTHVQPTLPKHLQPIPKYKSPGSRWQRSDLKNNFKDIREVHFVRFEFQKFSESGVANFLFLTYRTIYMASILIIFYYSTSCTKYVWKMHFMYFSQWSLCIQSLYGICFFFVTFANAFQHCCCYHNYKEEFEEMLYAEHTKALESRSLGTFEKFVWFLHNISIGFSLIVSFGYWLYYPTSNKYIGPLTECDDSTSISVFALSGLLSFVDLLVCAIPLRLGHAIYSIMSSAVYITFVLCYEFANMPYNCKKGDDCEYIYPFFNWSKRPGHAALSFLGYSLLPGLLHIILFFIYKLRILVLSLTCKNNAYLDHQYPFHLAISSVETSHRYFGLTDPDNPFPRRILINDGLPISRAAALDEVQKIRTIVPVSAQNINNEDDRSNITPFPPGFTGDSREF